MSLQVRSQTRPPHGGLWRLTHKISGTKFSSPSLNSIKTSIWRHERANDYPQSTDAEIEAQLCENHPDACGEAKLWQPKATRNLGLGDIMRGTHVIAQFKLKGSPIVPLDEANRRAGICADCPRNVDYRKPCTGRCQQLIDLVRTIVGGAKTNYDGRLKACGICLCDNHAQVHVPAEFLAKGVTPEQMAEFRTLPNCWKWKAIDAL